MTIYTTTTDRATAYGRRAETLETTADDRPHTLDALAGIDALPVLVTVHRDGRVTVETDRADAPRTPDLDAVSDDDGSHTADTDPDLHRQARRQGWDLVTGFTGQYGYHGPCMHASEYIGGGLARHVLTYGACTAPDGPHTCGDDDPDAVATWWTAVAISEDDGAPESWALAYRDAAPAASSTDSREV